MRRKTTVLNSRISHVLSFTYTNLRPLNWSISSCPKVREDLPELCVYISHISVYQPGSSKRDSVNLCECEIHTNISVCFLLSVMYILLPIDIHAHISFVDMMMILTRPSSSTLTVYKNMSDKADEQHNNYSQALVSYLPIPTMMFCGS